MTHKGGRLLSTLVCFLFSYLTLTFIGIADGTKDETELRYWINDHIE